MRRNQSRHPSPAARSPRADTVAFASIPGSRSVRTQSRCTAFFRRWPIYGTGWSVGPARRRTACATGAAGRPPGVERSCPDLPVAEKICYQLCFSHPPRSVGTFFLPREREYGQSWPISEKYPLLFSLGATYGNRAIPTGIPGLKSRPCRYRLHRFCCRSFMNVKAAVALHIYFTGRGNTDLFLPPVVAAMPGAPVQSCAHTGHTRHTPVTHGPGTGRPQEKTARMRPNAARPVRRCTGRLSAGHPAPRQHRR